MIIETISGNEVFPGFDLRVLLFYKKNAAAEEVPFHMAVKQRELGLASIGHPNFVMACPANRNHGNWTTARYAVVNLACIKISIVKKLPGDFIKHTKSLMLRVRNGAALQRIRIPFSGDPNASLSSGCIEGNFDILDPATFADLGIEVFPNTQRQFVFEDDEDVSDFYDVRVIEAEASPMIVPRGETLETDSGKEIKVFNKVSKRKISI